MTRADYQARYRAKHKDKIRAYGIAYREEHREELRKRARETSRLRTREHRRELHLKSRYGMTMEDYNKLFETQNRCCAICKAKQPSKRAISGWHLDHNHKTGKARKILCARCNLLVGHVENSWEMILEIKNIYLPYYEQS